MTTLGKKISLLRTGRPAPVRLRAVWRAVIAGFALGAAVTASAFAIASAQVIGQPGEGEPGTQEGAHEQVYEPSAPVTGQPAPDLDEPPQDTAEEDSLAPQNKAPRRPLDPFAAMLTRRGPSAVRLSSREPQLYKTTQGDDTFVFQTDGTHGFIRFPCRDGAGEHAAAETLECALLDGRPAEEIMILDARRSPRGDVTYLDQSGAIVLRVTASGGATLFEATPRTGEAPQSTSLVPLGGRAVLPVNRLAGSLDAPRLSFAVAERRMNRAARLMEERHGIYLTFMTPGTHEGDQAVLADAVLTAAKGIDIVASDPLGLRIIAERLAVIEFVPDAEPGLSLKDGALSVRYNPAGGLAGRPSSISVARYLESAL